MEYEAKNRVNNMSLDDEKTKKAAEIELERLLPDDESRSWRRELLKDVVAEVLVEYFGCLKGVKLDKRENEKREEMSARTEFVSD